MIYRFKMFAEYFATNKVRELLCPTCHSAEVKRERYDVIISRAQLIAQLFATLTPAWVLVDALTLEWPCWGFLAAVRVIVAAGFLMLARQRFVGGAGSAYRAIAALFALSTGFILVSDAVFWLFQDHQQAPFAAATYFNAPFLIAAGLGIFPFAAVESALLATSVLGAMTLSLLLRPELLNPFSASATLWRLFLIAAIGGLASMSQLRFLINLTEQSSRDALTQALTRKLGEQLLDFQFAAAARSGDPLSLIFIDLDRFKAVNDNYGHEAGDALLRCAAQSIQKGLRRQDILVRWGGEEFLAILPQTDCAGAEALVTRVAQAGIGVIPDGALQTASVGIAERKCDDARDWISLVNLADQRMYSAKRAGRNRYVGPIGQPMPFINGVVTANGDLGHRYGSVDDTRGAVENLPAVALCPV